MLLKSKWLIVPMAVACAATFGPQAMAQRWQDRGDDYGNYDDEGDGDSSYAVDQCSQAAADSASRYGQNARVTSIQSVSPAGDGFSVVGEVASYSQGWRGASYQRSRFFCRVDRGQIVALNFGQEGGNYRGY